MKLGAFIGSIFSYTSNVTKSTFNSVGAATNLISNELEEFEANRKTERVTTRRVGEINQEVIFAEAVSSAGAKLKTLDLTEATATLEAAINTRKGIESKLDQLFLLEK